jgi:hypothetical protein
MAVQTWYLSLANLAAAAYNALLIAVPGGANVAQGWTVGTRTAPNYSALQGDTISSAFNTSEPSAFSAWGYRTEQVVNGVYANSDWSLLVKVRADTAYYAQTGYVGFRLWRSANANGSGATQITPGWQYSTEVVFAAVSDYQAKTITWSPGATVTLTNEYLWVEIVWSCVTSGGNAAAKVYFVENEGAAETLTTPDFTAASAVSAAAILMRC